MLTLKNNKKQKNDLITTTKFETKIEQWEIEQLDVFSDIIISILLKENLNPQTNEK